MNERRNEETERGRGGREKVVIDRRADAIATLCDEIQHNDI